jgi:NTP pyrophosphatase (non-canonical NTP hydrolase)
MSTSFLSPFWQPLNKMVDTVYRFCLAYPHNFPSLIELDNIELRERTEAFLSTFSHLEEEVKEAKEALQYSDRVLTGMLEIYEANNISYRSLIHHKLEDECADIFLTLAAFCGQAGIDLGYFVQEKMKFNLEKERSSIK